MFSTKGEIKCAVLLVTFFVTSVKSVSENKETNPIMQVEETFDEIEENHHKLRQLFEDVVLKERSGTESQGCTCVPYYLCDAQKGVVIRDGSHLLQSRFGDGMNPCDSPQDVCCEPYKQNLENKINVPSRIECGFGSEDSTVENQQDDPPVSKFAEFPWTVMITIKGGAYKCVGSLIHPQVVLTAAHCINATEKYVVRAGEWNIASRNEPYSHQNEYVKTIIKHPEFNIVNLFYDAALLILENPFELDKSVNTACLTKAAPNLLNTIPDRCVGTGWGKLKGRYSTIMKKVRFSLVPHELCQKDFRTTRLGQLFELHQSFICASGQDGFDLCTGDGGSPLVCPIPGQTGRYQQVGITAWGLECEQNLPSAFTKLPQIRNWIDEQFDLLNYNKEYYTYKES